jgi:2',3'-cyclic-nucleotide 2'-phosphodiesterase (5'-nucleotidase family)
MNPLNKPLGLESSWMVAVGLLAVGLPGGTGHAEAPQLDRPIVPLVAGAKTNEEIDRLILPSDFAGDFQNGSPVLSLVVNSFRRSQVDPCGCPSKQLGGFDREAKIVERIREASPQALLADAGGFVREFASDLDILRTTHLIKAMDAVGYQVVNVAFPDVLPGVDQLRQMVDGTSISLVSANLTDPDGNRLFDPFVVRTVELPQVGPVRVAFVGATRQRLAGSPSLSGNFVVHGGQGAPPRKEDAKIQDPVEALREVLPQARQQSDVVVLLHYARRDQIPELLRNLGSTTQSLDMVVAGDWGGLLAVETTSTLPGLVTTGFEGRQVTHAVVKLDEDKRPVRYGATAVEIEMAIPPVENIAKILHPARNPDFRQTSPFVMPRTVPAIPPPPPAP